MAPDDADKRPAHLPPIACQVLIEFGGNLDEPMGLPSMPFVCQAIGSPIRAIERQVLKKEAQILGEAGLIALHHEQILASRGNHLLTEDFLGVQGVRTDDAPFEQAWSEKSFTCVHAPALSATIRSFRRIPVFASEQFR